MDSKSSAGYVRAYFDKMAANWENNPQEYGVREHLVSLMELPENGLILDIGCGRGVMTPHLLKAKPAHLIGVDLSGEMIRLAREEFSGQPVEFVQGDILEMDFPPADAAVIYNAYPHFMDKGALKRAMARLVKPGGSLIVAHGAGKMVINGRHHGPQVTPISIPLRRAIEEAAVFLPEFEPIVTIDRSEYYFIRMRRVQRV